MNPLYSISIRRADKTETTLGEFAGKVLLIVNVASKCGLTPQYDGLERIHEKYAEKGFTVLGFPANEFGAQEPGSDAEIQQFCRLNFGVKFPVFSKLVVKGPEQHPLYAYLTRECPEATKKGGILRKALRKVVHPGSFTGDSGEITWNFEKFLIDRHGKIAARFAPDVTPEDPVLVQAIEEELAEA
ncbi:MAG TPA: glutathione peroxidase [Fibrobacteria bacterium]|nr:glutathione peroxidase [Fibrobacteria bacterium]